LSAEEIKEMELYLDMAFEPLAQDAGEPPSLKYSTFVTEDLGMELKARLSYQQLSKRLGYLEDDLPVVFNKYRHSANLNAWDSQDLFKHDGKNQPELKPNRLHWHQLAGIHAIARSVFTKQPNHSPRGILVADDVGLGKTSLTIGFIALLNETIARRQRKHPDPPVFSESPVDDFGSGTDLINSAKFQYLGKSTKIPSRAHLIIAPGTISPQWINELKVNFKRNYVDIIEWDRDDPSFWREGGRFQSSRRTQKENIIVVATQSV
jgi:SNF2 family DNA or RNA helicase